MERIITSKEMRQFEAYTIQKIGIPSLVLMERAALAIVEQLYLQHYDLTHVAVVCGNGNNGGDGIAIARLLKLKNIAVTIYLVGNENDQTVEVQQQIQIARAYQVPIIKSDLSSLSRCSTVVDALLGIGLSREVTGVFAEAINSMNLSCSRVVSIDMPSGICATSGQVLGIAVNASMTIALAYTKLGLILYPGAQHAGKVITVDVGIYANDENQSNTDYYSLQSYDIAKLLPIRPAYSNKGSFGKVLVIAGSTDMCGAAYFSAKAAYHSGAGLVQIYTPQENRASLSSQLPEALITTYTPNQIAPHKLQNLLEWATVIVIGPGMGINANTNRILSLVLATASKPVIIDADGLNVLAKNLDLLGNSHPQAPIFITPHLGEMARLTSDDIAHIADNLITVAQKFSNRFEVTCVLKDSRTVITVPKSNRVYINQSGNNGMATGGSGDVLTGILAGLIAQGVDLDIVAPLSVYLHGLAGNRAAEQKGQYSMLASDIIDCLSAVMRIHI